MPAYDADDKAALVGLIKRYLRIFRSRTRDRELKVAVDKRLEDYPKQFEQLLSAFTLFGVSGFRDADWDKLANDMGPDLFWAAVEAIPRKMPLPELEPPRQEQSEQQERLENNPDEETTDNGEAVSGTVRDIVLHRLRSVGASGAKASDLRAYIEKVRGTVLHEKTVGMTLYRLSNDGAVRREGRTWFFVHPPEDETKNPGAVTPGLFNRDTKEGEEL